MILEYHQNIWNYISVYNKESKRYKNIWGRLGALCVGLRIADLLAWQIGQVTKRAHDIQGEYMRVLFVWTDICSIISGQD